MNDVISISNLELWTQIGVTAEERATEQRVLVSIELHTDTRKVAKTDDVKKGIDYEDVAEEIRRIAKRERKTLERLAEDIAAAVLKKYKSGPLRVTVTKFPLPGVVSISLTIARP